MQLELVQIGDLISSAVLEAIRATLDLTRAVKLPRSDADRYRRLILPLARIGKSPR